MRLGRFAVFAIAVCLTPVLRGEVLGDVLAEHGIAHGMLRSGEIGRRITSFAVSASASPFLIAYYDDDGSGTLPNLLHVLRYDARTGEMRRADLKGESVAFHGFGGVERRVPETCMGSALNVSERDGIVVVTTHITPSASCTLVLDPGLRVSAVLWGWVLARVGGELVFEESMIHFADVHAAHVSVYDPRRRQITRVYPGKVDRARAKFSAELQRYLPNSPLCKQHNIVCDPEDFSTDIEHVEVLDQGRSFAFDVQMSAESFGEGAMEAVPSRTVHYVCRRQGGTWVVSPG